MSWQPAWLEQATRWFDDRPVRERVLMLVAAVCLVLLAGWQFAVAPVLRVNDSLSGQLVQARQQTRDWQAQQAQLADKLREDPNAEMRAQLQSRRQRLAELDRQLQRATDRLIEPKAMVDLLKSLLSAQKNLSLVKLELLAPIPVYSEQESKSKASNGSDKSAPKPLLYAHDVVLTTEGGYLELLAYLKRLEDLDQRLGWRDLTYEVETFPKGRATIRVRTLSLDKAWLGV